MIVIYNYDQDLEVEIDDSELNLLEVGTYTIYYNAVDSSGNTAVTVTRTIIVEEEE